MAIAGWRSFTDIGRTVAVLGVALTLLVPGCELNRAGVGGGFRAPSVVVAPEFLCPGEAPTLRWDYSTLPRTTTNCTSCRTTAECDAASRCIDGVCCPDRYSLPPGDPALCRSSTGTCLPPSIILTLSSDPATTLPTPPLPMSVRGELPVPRPSGATNITAATRFAFPLSEIADVSRLRLFDALGDQIAMQMTFTCPMGGWDPYNFATRGPSTSDRMEIRGITNVTPQPVTLSLSGSGLAGITIATGETTTAFDGRPPRGLWAAFIPPSLLPDPRARPCEVLLGERPPINLSMRVICRPR
jgi:hypothetical protein